MRFKLNRFSFAEIIILLDAWLTFFKWDFCISYLPYKYWQLNFNHAALTNENQENVNQQNLNQENVNKENKENKSKELSEVINIIKLSEMIGRNHLRPMNCLRRCLTQQQLLQQRQYFCKLHIGVKITDGLVQAHSWLSFNGDIINDSNEVISQYTELNKNITSSVYQTLK